MKEQAKEIRDQEERNGKRKGRRKPGAPPPPPSSRPFSLLAEFLRGLFPCSPGAHVKADCSLSFTAVDGSLLHQLGKRPNCG